MGNQRVLPAQGAARICAAPFRQVYKSKARLISGMALLVACRPHNEEMQQLKEIMTAVFEARRNLII